MAKQAAAAPARPAGHDDSPAGFWYGTDSTTTPVGTSVPHTEPVIGGPYGGYIGMAGNWAKRLGCGDKVVWSAANSSDANNNYTWHGDGIGTGVYFFMGGPGVDPNYNGTVAEAYKFGEHQADWTEFDISQLKVKYPVVFADVELPGNAVGISPAPDNGWNSVYTSPCSGVTKASFIPANVDRATLDGYFARLTATSSFKSGVYSAPAAWAAIFGTGSEATLTGVSEWTYTAATSSLTKPPSGFCIPGTSTCAQFFGGITSSDSEALMWQWSGGGGVTNGVGDFDQIDANRTP